jgi:diguanylate cyclase (GGDEF)-like protein
VNIPHSLKTSLKTRLLIGIGAMLVPLVGLGIGSFVCIETAVKRFEKAATEVDKEMFPLTRLQTLIVQASIPAKDYHYRSDPAERGRFIHLSQEIDNIFADVLGSPTFGMPQEQVLVRAAQNKWQQARTFSEAIFARSHSMGAPRAVQDMERVEDHTDQAVELLDHAYKVVHQELAENLAHAQAVKWQGLSIVVTSFGLGLGTFAIASFVLTRSILLPVSVLKEGISRFGEGDLSQRINLTTRDELEEVAVTFNLMASNLEHSQTELKELANMDKLTGLPNRALFMNRLERAVLHAKKRSDYVFAVLFVDLDRFKLINDKLGHMAGDELLIAIARRLMRCVRDEDTIARLGGDEFALLLNDIKDVSQATNIAERIKHELMKPFNLSGHQVFTSASMGVVLGSKAHGGLDDLLHNADMAMYHAKALGKARYQVFDSAMHSQAVTRLQIETDLKRAIEHQEFQVHYQPIVLLETGRITGFEALVRWKHPIHGLISPDEFIPMAKETGLIVPLDQWVLREACRQMHAWQLQFPTISPLTISVNVSAKQFMQPNFTSQVTQILQETNLDTRSLRLELKESVLMENAESVTPVLLLLKALGVSLSLDDFGRGYSSLSHLHRFPIDTLKIDRSLINKMDYGDKNSDIIRAITMLSQALGMDAIAEGIETAHQLFQLNEIQCKYGQGYFFCEPLDGATAGDLIAHKLDGMDNHLLLHLEQSKI